MKRITAILLALVLCITLLPAFACAVEWEYVDNTSGKHTSETSALTIKNGQCVRGAITGTPTENDEYSFSQTDYYKFTLTEKSIISLYAVDGNFYMGLIDGMGGKRIATTSNFDGKSASRLFMALDAGTYTVEVSYNEYTAKSETGTENYELYFECKKASTVAPSEENTLGMGNFQKTATYTDGQFTDVAPNQWFYENVKTAYELGIVKGTGANSYGSKNTVTLAEALALASRLHSIYHTGKADFKQGDVWYQVYLDYAISNGIIRNCGPVTSSGEYGGYATTAATREQFVCMMKNAFPDSEFPAINNIEKGKIPDVSTVSFNADAIYAMYNAGIVTGNDSYGTFTPNNTITRSEVAAIIARMVDSSLRKHFTISDKPIEVTGVSLSQTTLSLTIGKTSSIKAYVWPEKATDRAVTWTSSNSKVATVNNGTVSAISAGTATITATTTNGKAASCTVTVKEAGIYDYVAPTVQQYVGGFRTMPVVEDNSVGGVMVKWEADYLGTQNVNYYTVYLTLCDNFGKEVKDVITGKTGVAMKVVGPVKPGGKLMLYNIVGYSPVCTVVKIDKIELEFADGTKIIGDYPFTIKGGNPNNDGF